MEEESQPANYAVHALAGYSNPLMIMPTKEPKFEDMTLKPKEKDTPQPATHTVPTLAGYTNLQKLKIEGFLEQQSVIILIDAGSTHNFMSTRAEQSIGGNKEVVTMGKSGRQRPTASGSGECGGRVAAAAVVVAGGGSGYVATTRATAIGSSSMARRREMVGAVTKKAAIGKQREEGGWVAAVVGRKKGGRQ
ncbi:hypothetical protein BHE74_00018289 [Ensete ventricosum]|nr:hypothetical protein BHE74_00018289 [Ensete ventricosum]